MQHLGLTMPDHVGQIGSRILRVCRPKIRDGLIERAALSEILVDEVLHRTRPRAVSGSQRMGRLDLHAHAPILPNNVLRIPRKRRKGGEQLAGEGAPKLPGPTLSGADLFDAARAVVLAKIGRYSEFVAAF